MSNKIIKIGLPESQIRDFFRILDEWDSKESQEAEAVAARESVRLPFELKKMAVLAELNQRKDTLGDKYWVRVRNLSSGGISVIHGVTLKVGQVVEIQLPECGIQTRGTIARRRTLIDPIHEYGIRFDASVDISGLESDVKTSGRLLAAG